jgi:hypothetical protein
MAARFKFEFDAGKKGRRNDATRVDIHYLCQQTWQRTTFVQMSDKSYAREATGRMRETERGRRGEGEKRRSGEWETRATG